MGLSSKQVTGDQGLDWDHALLQPAAELPKLPLSTRRQQRRLQEMEAVKCPRCDSTNTKFCYYNNYNKSQPRHFCKSCKRHWTKGGTLRNVPVGGGRKNKRPKISNAPSATTDATFSPLMGPTLPTQYTNQITDFSKLGSTEHSKDVSSFIYEALIGSSSLHETIPFIESNNETGPPENLITDFQFSSSSSNFDVNSSLVPNSDYGYDQFCAILDSMEESTVTTVNVPATTSMPWPDLGPDTSYWNWNEIDVLTSADHLNMAWDDDDDDAEIKP